MDFPIEHNAHARACYIFDHFRQFTLFFNVIQNCVVNFAYLSPTRNDLTVDKCRLIPSFRYMKVSYLQWLL